MATSVASLRPHPSLSSSSFVSSSFPSKRPLSFPSLKTTPPPLPLKLLCSRDSRGPKKSANADPVYRNRLVSLMVNRVLKNGKKSLAFYIMYHAMKRIRDKTGSNPLLVLRDAVKNVTPDVAVKARRVGGASVQVPVEVNAAQGKAIAIRWLLEAARKRRGQDMVVKLSSELLEAASGSGEAVRRKEAVHRMAESNRAFAHFR